MKDTYFSVPDSKTDRISTLYTVGKDGALIRQTDEESAAIRRSQKSYFSGGGGLYSTAPDYFRFAQMLLNGGEYNGVRILSPKTVELMNCDSTGGIDILQGTGHTLATHGDRYGLGIGIRAYRGDIESIGSYGWGGAFNTLFWVDPEEKLIGIIMSQVGSQPDKTMHRVFRIEAYAAMTE